MNEKWQWMQPISKEIFKRKSMINKGDENIEGVFREIAREVSSLEKETSFWETRFYNELISGRFIPAGRILANTRKENHKEKNLLNCYVIPIEDSMDGITQALKDYMRILSMGGGVGFNISSLRPNGAFVSSGGETSGPISFLEIFDQASKTISLGGGRRGASIAILNIDHPDIEEFITVKQGNKNKRLTQFNISVGVTDEFINAVKHDLPWDLIFKGKVYKTVQAKELYDKLMKNAYTHNEPGIFNLDHVNDKNNGFYMYDIEAPNPCGEQPLSNFGACNLGALNYTQFINNPFTDEASIDWESMQNTIEVGVRFLDNVLDLTAFPLKQIEERVLGERRIGLGYTGYGNMLSMLKLKYGEPKSLEIAEKLGEFLRDISYKTSTSLAKEKSPFPLYKKDFLKSGFVKSLPEDIIKNIEKHGIRNIAVNTVAPTGTISLSVGQNCSSGIEPAFSLAYNRTIRKDKGDETEKQEVFDYAWLLYKEKFKTSKKPDWMSLAFDVKPKEHILMQAAFQKYVDASISKTINLPKETTFEEYEDLFMFAYEHGLKGTTSFFEGGSIPGILSISSEKEDSFEKENHAPKRPESLPCEIHEINVNKERHLVLCGFHEGKLYEIFVTPNADNKIDVGKYKSGFVRKVKKGVYELIVRNGEEKSIIPNIGKAFDEMYCSLSRFISMSLRHGVSLKFIVEQLQKDSGFISFERAVSRVLKRYIKDGEISTQKCSECGSNMEFRDGCILCSNCGESRCN